MLSVDEKVVSGSATASSVSERSVTADATALSVDERTVAVTGHAKRGDGDSYTRSIRPSRAAVAALTASVLSVGAAVRLDSASA